MAELADAPDLGSGIARCEGSSPFARTIEIPVKHKQGTIIVLGENALVPAPAHVLGRDGYDELFEERHEVGMVDQDVESRTS